MPAVLIDFTRKSRTTFVYKHSIEGDIPQSEDVFLAFDCVIRSRLRKLHFYDTSIIVFNTQMCAMIFFIKRIGLDRQQCFHNYVLNFNNFKTT